MPKNNQQTLFDITELPTNPDYISESQKRKWRDGLQKFCDNAAHTEGHDNGFCMCGLMSYCDKCFDSDVKMGCARAIVKTCKDKNISIDYKDFDYRKFLERLR